MKEETVEADTDWVGVFLALVVSFAFLAIAATAGYSFGKFTMEHDAIKSGVGEYYLDKDYQRQFRFVSQASESA